MDSQAVADCLEDGLFFGPPEWVAFRNLLFTNTVELSDVLGEEVPACRLMSPHSVWEASLSLLVEGEGSVFAQMGVSQTLLDALGIGRRLRLSMLDAVAAQIVSPALPALRAFFEQDVTVRLVLNDEGSAPASRWVNFRIVFYQRFSEPCRVHAAFLGKLHQRALEARRRPRRDVMVPMFLGERLQLPVSQVRSLQPGDVVLSQDRQARHWELCIARSVGQPHRRLAVVNASDGCVVHLSPGSWLVPPAPPAGHGPWIDVDVVVGRLEVPAEECRRLTRGQGVPRWAAVTWLDKPELCVGSRLLFNTNAVRVAGRAGYELAPAAQPAASPRSPRNSVRPLCGATP